MNVVVTSLVSWRVCLRTLIYQLLQWTSSETSFKPVLYVIIMHYMYMYCVTYMYDIEISFFIKTSTCMYMYMYM